MNKYRFLDKIDKLILDISALQKATGNKFDKKNSLVLAKCYLIKVGSELLK